MSIHVRSVVLSQECEVIVEPSTEANFPTKMLVQDSIAGRLSSLVWAVDCTAGPWTASINNPTQIKNAMVHFFIGLLLSFPFFGQIRKKNISLAAGSQIGPGSISVSVISKGFISAFRNGFAPVKIFSAIPSPLFSAAAELRAVTPDFYLSSLCSHDCSVL
jgi:hypothetical protein